MFHFQKKKSFAFDCSNFSKNITTYNIKWKIQSKWMFCQNSSFVLILCMFNEMQIKTFTSIYKVKLTHIILLIQKSVKARCKCNAIQGFS